MGEVRCCRICGLPIGIFKHIQKDTRGSKGLVQILGGCGTILVLTTAPACTTLIGHATSPSHTAVLVCERPG
ncbi:unnamed protein product [Staurois parvus]|uniref:Uncharacterized protein n=1 Tax=Staurois parvus TaxID=386267 RepID=A0ABN9HQU8_9NEOB|nr:unnamed protein product [Staurois parvus]